MEINRQRTRAGRKDSEKEGYNERYGKERKCGRKRWREETER